ncbi:MAG: 50S ribosomal protein L25/general stress protein Ctc [Gammaproteobacteria bacterium]|nr:MAG: 50S ribosomal protein L25/general stress protein Ctc [Gammaproteobacteria bacterium]
MEFNLVAKKRSDSGKGASRRLRHAGLVPCIIYGAGKDPQPIELAQNILSKAVESEEFFSQIINIDVEGAVEKVVIKDLQRHVYKPLVQHADFMRIDENKKLKSHIPLHFTGEAESIGLKKGGVLNHELIEAEVICLPKDLPSFLEVDVSGLDVGQSVHLTDIKLPAGVELAELNKGGEEHNLSVATVNKVRATSDEAESEEAESAE